MNDIIKQLQALPSRRGPAPRMTPSNPQEQLEQFPEDWSLIEELGAFAFALDGVHEAPTQIAPPGSRALTLNAHDATTDRDAFMVDLEFAHIHNLPIGSMHLTLPQALRELAVDKGWALRHPLAVRGVVSKDVTFVFAPRDRAELEVVKLLVAASLLYATQSGWRRP